MSNTDEIEDGTPAERIDALRATNAASRAIARARAAAAESVRNGRGKTPGDLAILWNELQPVTPLSDIDDRILVLLKTAAFGGVRAATVSMRTLKAIGWDLGTCWGHPVATHLAHDHAGRQFFVRLEV